MCSFAYLHINNFSKILLLMLPITAFHASSFHRFGFSYLPFQLSASFSSFFLQVIFDISYFFLFYSHKEIHFIFCLSVQMALFNETNKISNNYNNNHSNAVSECSRKNALSSVSRERKKRRKKK